MLDTCHLCDYRSMDEDIWPFVETARLDLLPLPGEAAGELMAGDRTRASELIGADLEDDWPLPDLEDVLPLQRLATPAAAAYGIWLVVDRETATVIGDVGFMGPPGSDGDVEIGYSVSAAHRRQGVAGEAVGGLVEWAFEQPDVMLIRARCEPDNAASIRVLEANGFAPDGQEGGRRRFVRHRPPE
jgi:[ribosomal protein S5]-alanine N-acetyltransferase